MGAAAQATSSIPIGTGVTPTAARYHPAMIAQAWATLERMYPGRAFLGIGSGEALNEVPVGDEWPSPRDQIARMDEALGYIDRLWKGETITEEGRFYRLTDCKLHTLPERRPPVWISAFGPQAAAIAGKWGDGLWTLPDPEGTPAVIEAYREARAAAGAGATATATARSSSRRCSRGRRPTRRRSSPRGAGRAPSRPTTSCATGTARRRCTSTARRR